MKLRFTQRSMTGFKRSVDSVTDFVENETPVLIRDTGRDFCKSAMRRTPMAKGPAKKVRGKGFAKAGWVVAMEGLGMEVKSSYHKRGGKKYKQFGELVDRRKDTPASVEIANQVPYIEYMDRGGDGHMANHILSKSVKATAFALRRNLGRMGRRMDDRWGR